MKNLYSLKTFYIFCKKTILRMDKQVGIKKEEDLWVYGIKYFRLYLTVVCISLETLIVTY